ncbi:zinc ribbon domain-containing protein [Pseudobutyrivibrio sp.]|uniref:zinc ribbon domain-containing protein n=1 Tax=Pseudobutyrivibrio sp. TaxID=2014367 RepID=UPI001D62E2F5|nr:zinc ribbon domain-containing protein [Pseudobutyrivibrio sp.]MBE5911693.1 zinc ribbon domain-containing protein [Pseudobutyrivibrio sp.]
MIFCKECGTELGDEAVFCTTCGAKIERAEAVQQATQQYQQQQQYQQPQYQQQYQQYQQPQYQQPMQPRKPISKKSIAAIIAVVVVIIACLVAKNTVFAPKIDLEECLLVDVTGFDGAGRLDIDIDYDTLMWEISDMNDNISDDKIYELVSSISFEPSEDENLSNGQEIKIKVKYKESLAKKCKVKFNAEDITYTVEGLNEVTEIDPFEYVNVFFEGYSPNGSVEIQADGIEDIGALSYEADKTEGLANGDTVTVKCTSEESRYNELGYKFTQTSKEYTVEGLEAYVTSPSEIDEATLARLQEKALAEITDDLSYVTDLYEIEHTDYTYEGMVVLTGKEMGQWNKNDNEVILIYSTTASCEDFETTTFYLPYRFEDVIKYEDGTIDYQNDEAVYESNGDYYFGAGDYYKGYDDASTMFTELVRNNTDDYDYEISSDLEDLYNQ